MNPCCEMMLEMPRFRQKYKDLCPTLNGGTVNLQLVNVAVFKATQTCLKVCAPVPATHRPNSIAEGACVAQASYFLLPALRCTWCGTLVGTTWHSHLHDPEGLS